MNPIAAIFQKVRDFFHVDPPLERAADPLVPRTTLVSMRDRLLSTLELLSAKDWHNANSKAQIASDVSDVIEAISGALGPESWAPAGADFMVDVVDVGPPSKNPFDRVTMHTIASRLFFNPHPINPVHLIGRLDCRGPGGTRTDVVADVFCSACVWNMGNYLQDLRQQAGEWVASDVQPVRAAAVAKEDPPA